ncbi:MAG: hypothetical protein V3U50_04760 [Acidimicrobiia bacterium]
MTGLEPREFTWVIQSRLAVSERVGGYGFQHRRVRREEEITWLKNAGITCILSLLDGNQNMASYEESELVAYHEPLSDLELDAVRAVFDAMDLALSSPDEVLLIHRDIIDDAVAGVLAGYLVHSGLIDDPIVAIAAIQEILKRPLGPEARAIVPEAAGA